MISDVIEALGATLLTVTRTAAGARVSGRYTSGAVTTLNNVVAGVEPLTGRELLDTPEGARGDEVIMIYTATAILPVRSGFEADRVAYTPPGYENPGGLWEVTAADTLEGIDGVHYEVRACRPPSPRGQNP